LGALVFNCQRWNSWIYERLTSAKAFVKDVFINQERKLGDRRRSDTVVVLTINDADQGLEDVLFWIKMTLPVPFYEKSVSLWVLGGVWSQGWNLKELTEGHHQEWSLRLNLTQHGKTYQVQTQLGLTDWELFLDSVGGGAWPFLVGGVICLVNSDNERDLSLLISCINNNIYEGF